jgi:predicted NodU family carbamoyl transferase
MKIVGYQSGRHDVSYCILENGVPIIHEELERLVRVKEPFGDGLKMFFERIENTDDIDHFVFGNPYLDKKYVDDNSQNKLNNLLDITNKKHWIIGHHKSHAANAFFSSNYDKALIFTIDGGGTEENGVATAFTVWEGINNKIEPIDIIPITTLNLGSPWRLYTKEIFNLSSGYPKGNQSGTVMALACVGNPDKYFNDFYQGFIVGGGGHNPKVWDNCAKYKPIAEQSEQDKFDVAAALQKATEVVTDRKSVV